MADRRIEVVNRRAVVTVSGAALIAPLVQRKVEEVTQPDREAIAAGRVQDLASGAPDAPSILNKADRDQNLADMADLKAARASLGDFAANADAEAHSVPAALTTITINGFHEAGDHPPTLFKEIPFASDPKPWHRTTNVNTRRWEQITDGLLDVRPFGVRLGTGAAAAANTGYLQDAFDFCREKAGGIGVRVPGLMYFDGQVTNDVVSPLVCHGEMIFTGGGEDALVFGEAGGRTIASPNMVMTSVINLKRASLDWTDQHSGIVIRNTANWIGWLSADSFHVGIDHYVEGADAGNMTSAHYNNFFLKRVNRNQIGLRIWAKAHGAINESSWFGGEFQIPSTVSSNDDVVGVQFRRDANAFIINHHRFWGPSFEIRNGGAGDAVIFQGYSDGGQTDIANNIRVYGARREGPDYLLGGDGISSSTFEFSRSGTAAVLGDEIIKPLNANARLRLGANTFDFGNDGPYGWGQPKKLGEVGRQHVVGQTPGGTLLTTKPARGCIYVADPSYDFVFHSASVTMTSGGLGLAAASNVIFGMLFDLRTAGEDYDRRITVKVHTTGTGGRIAAVCYDASFNRLEDAAGTAGHCSLTWTASKGLYRQGGDLNTISNETEVLFGPDVKYVVLGVGPGAADAAFKRVEYFAASGSDIGVCYDPDVVAGIGVTTVNSVSVAPILDRDEPLATQMPTEPAVGNSYPVGLKVLNVDPAAAETSGWRRGATWLPEGERGGVTADVGDAAATLTVNSSKVTQIWDTPLTEDRAVTLSTAGAVEGARFVIVRTAAATGAFSLNVGTGPLKALAAGSRCEVTYNGSAWVLTDYATL